MKNEDNKIVKFDRGFQFNIGVFLIAIIALYLGFQVFSLITKKEVSVYEITMGTIVDKNFYQGLAIRQEEIYYADRAGDIYYYENNGTRVGMKSFIYAIDTVGNTVRTLKENINSQKEINKDDLKEITPKVESFMGNFSEVNFAACYNFMDDIQDMVTDIQLDGAQEKFADTINNARTNGSYIDYSAPRPGFLVFTVDGYEGKTYSEITNEDFNSGGININNLRIRNSVNEGEPVYKLITSDDWQLMIPIDSEKAKDLSGKDTIELRFTQDDSKTWATCEIISKGNENYLLLGLDDSMERYASQRFVNVELLIDETEGLKIPNTAIRTKDFYVIPKSYFFAGGNSNDLGLLVKRNNSKDEFIIPTIYYETKDAYYVDNEMLLAGDKLVMENSSQVYSVGVDTASLEGVYNINKGYAVFRSISPIYKNEEYTIIRASESYSVYLYDHIVLDSSSVKENEIL